MKIAYLTSKYPGLSHTFILREVQALRGAGIDVGTFTVRKAPAGDVLGAESEAEAARTRWLVPVPWLAWMRAAGWALLTRPRRLLQALWHAVARGVEPRQRLVWLCYFCEALLLAWWLVQEGFEHLHCHFGNSGASTGMLAAELAGMPFSFTCHGSELRAPERHFLAEKIARAAFVACVSWYGRAQLMLLCPPEHWPKLHVVRCGLPPLDAPTRRRAGVRPRVLCVGRLSAEKGHQVLFQALSALRARGVDLDCTLVGDGPQRAALMAESTALGLSDRVRFAGGLELDQVLEHYGQADVLVLSSLSEGVPVVLMEAMALGCPVVATSVGGVPELVRNRETGLLVPPGNPRELADALQWVLDHPDDAQQVAAEAARRVRKEFALSSTTGALIRLFEGSRSCAKPCPAVAEPVPA